MRPKAKSMGTVMVMERNIMAKATGKKRENRNRKRLLPGSQSSNN
jgi:hypothetical protein